MEHGQERITCTALTGNIENQWPDLAQTQQPKKKKKIKKKSKLRLIHKMHNLNSSSTCFFKPKRMILENNNFNYEDIYSINSIL